MSTLYITEYAAVNQNGIPKEPKIADQAVTFTGTAGVSAAFGTNTRFVRLQPDAICSVVFSTYTAGAAVNPTALTSNRRMAASETALIEVPAGVGFKVSAIANT